MHVKQSLQPNDSETSKMKEKTNILKSFS